MAKGADSFAPGKLSFIANSLLCSGFNRAAAIHQHPPDALSEWCLRHGGIVKQKAVERSTLGTL